MKSIFEHKYTDLQDEIFEKILEHSEFFVERIISKGQKTPDGEWLSQERAELVFLLKGWARLSFKSSGKEFFMRPGDYLLINPFEEHRVEETAKDEETIWLAIHFKV